jgi:hypothetical protein
VSLFCFVLVDVLLDFMFDKLTRRTGRYLGKFLVRQWRLATTNGELTQNQTHFVPAVIMVLVPPYHMIIDFQISAETK